MQWHAPGTSPRLASCHTFFALSHTTSWDQACDSAYRRLHSFTPGMGRLHWQGCIDPERCCGNHRSWLCTTRPSELAPRRQHFGSPWGRGPPECPPVCLCYWLASSFLMVLLTFMRAGGGCALREAELEYHWSPVRWPFQARELRELQRKWCGLTASATPSAHQVESALMLMSGAALMVVARSVRCVCWKRWTSGALGCGRMPVVAAAAT